MSSLSLRVRLSKATEAALLSRMVVFHSGITIDCHVIKRRLVNSYRPMNLQPVETSVIVYRHVATCDKTQTAGVLQPNGFLSLYLFKYR